MQDIIFAIEAAQSYANTCKRPYAITKALELERAAEQFRKVCRESGENRPIVFMQNKLTGLGVFVSDHRYTGIIKKSFLEYD